MGKQVNGKTRCKCKKCEKTFQIQYANNDAKPQTKQLIIKIPKWRGIRDISRVLNISSNTVASVFKKISEKDYCIIFT
jgi:transposase-like protein